jgi:hypothetical protein
MSVIRFEFGGGEADLDQAIVDGAQVGARHMRQDQVLLVADAHLVEGIGLGDVGHRVHLAVAGVAGNLADALQRDRHRRIIRITWVMTFWSSHSAKLFESRRASA